jgi:peptidyl-prolyl cis-trans isomerase C
VKKDALLLLIGGAVVALLCYGIYFYRSHHKSVMEGEGTSSASSTSAAASEAVIAHVNDDTITKGEFDVAFSALPPEQQAQLGANSNGVITEQLVKMKLLAQEAKRRGWDKEPSVQAQLKLNETDTLVKAAIVKMQQQHADEAALRAQYEKDKSQFTTLNVRHILVAYEGGQAPPRSGKPLPLDQAQAKANAIYEQLQKGADFGKLAAQLSDDTQSAQRGGMVGAVRKGMLPPDIEYAVLDLEKGQISKPVRSQFGIHIFQAVDKTIPPYEQVKDQLAQQSQGSKIQETVDNLMKTGKIQYDPKYTPPVKPKGPAAAVEPPAATGPAK